MLQRVPYHFSMQIPVRHWGHVWNDCDSRLHEEQKLPRQHELSLDHTCASKQGEVANLDKKAAPSSHKVKEVAYITVS